MTVISGLYEISRRDTPLKNKYRPPEICLEFGEDLAIVFSIPSVREMMRRNRWLTFERMMDSDIIRHKEFFDLSLVSDIPENQNILNIFVKDECSYLIVMKTIIS